MIAQNKFLPYLVSHLYLWAQNLQIQPAQIKKYLGKKSRNFKKQNLDLLHVRNYNVFTVLGIISHLDVILSQWEGTYVCHKQILHHFI